MKGKSLTIESFAELFATSIDDFPLVCHELIAKNDFTYDKLTQLERDSTINTILQRINSGEMWVSGVDMQEVWERGWTENLLNYQQENVIATLTPKFIRPNQILRLSRDYIRPRDPHFEYNFVDIYRHWAFLKYLGDSQSIHEFGCGSCQHLPVLVKLFPTIPIHGIDWAKASKKIIDTLVARYKWNVTGHIANLYSPSDNLPLDSASGVITIGTLEQLGDNFEPFLQFLMRKRPRIVLHMETIAELYDESFLADYLALLYDRKRNYLTGYLERLRQLESEGKIEILNAIRVYFGSMHHDSYSLLVWRPK